MTPQIIVVEDDADVRELLRNFLSQAGYLVRTAEDGIKALKLIEKVVPDLILLDLNLPNMKGEVVCREIKKDYPEIQVIMLTARGTTSDVVQGLSLGADDYITKPFDMDEVLARVKARLRNWTTTDATLKAGDLTYNPKTLLVTRGGNEISLTPQEMRILEYLLINKGQVLTREMILSRLWKTNPDIETRVVDVYIGYLRKKIDADAEKKLIHSVRGFGYKIVDD